MTPIQARVLEIIRRHILAEGVPPTLEAIRLEMGWSSKSVVQRCLKNLQAQGLVDWVPHQHHSLRILSEGPTRATIEQWSDDELQRVHMVIRAVREARVAAKGRAAA